MIVKNSARNWQGCDLSWRDVAPGLVRQLPVGLAQWLVSTDSLTQRLIDHCETGFSVRVLRQSIERPLASESAMLGLPRGRFAFVRQVHLLCGKCPVVYARTVIPIDTAHTRLRGLTRLGTRPLGAVLFSSPGMWRGNIQLGHIGANHGLNSLAHQGLDAEMQSIWGRRSLFYLYNQPLLVSEIFLSDFPFGYSN